MALAAILAVKAVRSDARRRTHEHEAAAMNQLLATERNADWEQIAPCLDGALSQLSPLDQDALTLRYFERKSAREMAKILGTSDVRRGATMVQIGQVLRHHQIQTTEIYAKVDVNALRALAQPWPGGVR